MSAPMSRTKLVAVLLFAFATGAAAIAYGCYRLYQIAQIQNGPTVEGRATGWDTRPSRNRTVYRVNYAFDADGVTYTGGPIAVPKDTYDGTQKSPALAVRHAANRTDWHLPEAA